MLPVRKKALEAEKMDTFFDTLPHGVLELIIVGYLNRNSVLALCLASAKVKLLCKHPDRSLFEKLMQRDRLQLVRCLFRRISFLDTYYDVLDSLEMCLRQEELPYELEKEFIYADVFSALQFRVREFLDVDSGHSFAETLVLRDSKEEKEGGSRIPHQVGDIVVIKSGPSSWMNQSLFEYLQNFAVTSDNVTVISSFNTHMIEWLQSMRAMHTLQDHPDEKTKAVAAFVAKRVIGYKEFLDHLVLAFVKMAWGL